MAHRVCPYWLGFLLVNPFRRLMHDPEKIMCPFVEKGMTVLDIGPGMGFFTLPLAEMVGPGGRVFAVDVQEKMLQSLKSRAGKARLADRIITRVCKPDSLDPGEFEGTIDFALAFAVVHEAPDEQAFFHDVSRSLKPGARCLVAEPKGHVSVREFEQSLSAAEREGLKVEDRLKINRCHAALLAKKRQEN